MSLKRDRGARPIWLHLAVFALSVVVPLWALLGFLAATSLHEARRDYEAQTRVVARNFAQELERELAGFAGVLRALATSPALRDGDLGRFHAQAIEMAPAGGAIVMRDRAGQQIINSLFPFGTPLPVTTVAPVREADECVFRTRAPCISDLYVGTTDRQPYVLLNVPVLRNNEVAFALNVGFRAQHLATVLSGSRLPDGWNVSIVDRNRRIVARSPDHGRFVGDEVSATLRPALSQGEGSVLSVNLAGVPVWSAFVRLPSWGWHVVIGVPRAVLEAPWEQSVRQFALAGLLAVAFSVGGALLVGRRLARPFAQLSALMERDDRTQVLPVVKTSISELDRMSRALSEGSRRLRTSLAERDQAQAELQIMNAGLQARIEAEVAAREETQRRLAHSQRMEAMGQLAGGIAHDFNNILQAIQGGARLLEGNKDADERTQRLAKMIADSASRGAAVTRRLLALAQRADLRSEAVDAAELLSVMHEIFSHTLGAGIEVRVQVEPGVPPLLADRHQLETALVNLAANARDAMDGKGTLFLSAAVETVAAGHADGTPLSLQPGAFVRLTVSDTGLGMNEATLARATEPFFTTKPQGQGTGLGLAMVRGFAEQSGGTLRIMSAPSRGTSVHLWLPVASESARKQAPEPPPAPLADLRRRVLVVDDEAAVRSIVGEGLKEAGFAVVLAGSGREALGLLDAGEPVDILVTDLSMPAMDGLALIQNVQARRGDLPAVLLTGYATDMAELAVSGAMSGRFTLLRKPVEARALADRVAVLLAHSESRTG